MELRASVLRSAAAYNRILEAPAVKRSAVPNMRSVPSL